tara:strand:+ start:1132 stop:1950 length:819 start_codon:yes stop_codon:yes gene_type:complete
MKNVMIGVAGCAGRMGLALVKQICETKNCSISGGTEVAGHKAIGIDLGAISGLGNLGINVDTDIEKLFKISDAVIDFSSPKSTSDNALHASETRTILVAGTTGLSNTEKMTIKQASQNTAIVYSANMSVGVNMLQYLVSRLAKNLDENEFDIEILEMHHKYKIDSPSGTALALGEAAAEGRGKNLEDISDRGRDGISDIRKVGNIGFASLRGGSVPGNHSVIFASENERLELNHIAQDRSLFASGAIKAALWAQNKKPGLYSMHDVLELSKF